MLKHVVWPHAASLSSTVTAAQLIEDARAWLGTPYRHQGSIKGLGCDCVGFLAEVAVETRLITPQLRAEFPTDYARFPSAGELRRLTSRHLRLVPYDARAPGDIVLMRFAEEPQHLGMLTAVDPDQLIHCGQHGVVEHRIDSVWRARIVRVYRFPGLTPTHPPPLEAGEEID
jgi:NlpC/P60 family putative phage cell wall peptidase